MYRLLTHQTEIKIPSFSPFFLRFLLSEYINIKAEEVLEVILSGDDKPPSSAADSVNSIITKSYEDDINVNKQQTNSSMSITKESGEAGENDAL